MDSLSTFTTSASAVSAYLARCEITTGAATSYLYGQ